MSAFIDLTGKRFGRLTVKQRGSVIGNILWVCECDCGTRKLVPGYALRKGESRSCGCFQREDIAMRSRLNNKPWTLDKRIGDFWKRVNKIAPNGCWLWDGKRNNTGYGCFHYRKKRIFAHRFSWLIHTGKMPSQFVLHKCDTPLCVNPDHLFEGTARDNALDKIAKGRNPKTLPAACKINDDMVRLLRDRWVPYKVSMAKLAKEFGLHIKTVETALYKRKGVI